MFAEQMKQMDSATGPETVPQTLLPVNTAVTPPGGWVTLQHQVQQFTHKSHSQNGGGSRHSAPALCGRRLFYPGDVDHSGSSHTGFSFWLLIREGGSLLIAWSRSAV